MPSLRDKQLAQEAVKQEAETPKKAKAKKGRN